MRNRRMIVTGVWGTCGVVLAAGVLAGCSNTRATVYRMNPTPTLDTRAQSPDEIQNSLTLINDSDFRYFWNDMGRLWLMDRRSELDPGPWW